MPHEGWGLGSRHPSSELLGQSLLLPLPPLTTLRSLKNTFASSLFLDKLYSQGGRLCESRALGALLVFSGQSPVCQCAGHIQGSLSVFLGDGYHDSSELMGKPLDLGSSGRYKD